jgi:hypothetical protein
MAHSVSLSWTASSDAVSGYFIYRGSAPGAESATALNATAVTGTTYVDTTAGPGPSYYVVKSVLNGVESIASNEIEAVILPAPPTNLTLVSAS